MKPIKEQIATIVQIGHVDKKSSEQIAEEVMRCLMKWIEHIDNDVKLPFSK
jgi:hypothetical protein